MLSWKGIKLKTKKKALIVIACLLIALAVVVGIVFYNIAHPVEAEAEIQPVDNTAELVQKVDTTIYKKATYAQEGYLNLKEWFEALQISRAKYANNARMIATDYADYFDEEELAAIEELAVSLEGSDSFSKLNTLTPKIDEWQAMATERQEEAQAAQAQAAVSYVDNSPSTGYNTSSSIHANNIAQASTWSGDASSAKAWIINHESGGSYTATNGRYYGAYQLDVSYLGGDLSPENQDRVAEEYVNNRYGGWDGAMSFWQSHGWY